MKKVAKSILTGRRDERALLDGVLRAEQAQLVVLYGRRRVGKTYLVRQHLEPKAGTYLEVTGTKGGSAALQRRRFREAIETSFAGGQILPDFRSWNDGFSYLAELVERRAAAQPDKSIVLFFDELPWLATPRSRLLSALDYTWNVRLSRVPQVNVVLCGSAASWMLRRIVHSKGGLHNRITHRIRLEPFTIRETHEYLRSRRLKLDRREVLQLYMALGGVPYYLSLLERGESVAQAIGRLCFERAGPLRTEFDDVFASLFDSHQDHVSIVVALSKKKAGLSRSEVIRATGLSTGGGLQRRLEELEEAGFIARMEPYEAKVKNSLYRLIDEYTLFYLKWIRRAPRGILSRGASSHWQGQAQTPAYAAWAGYAFESVCLKHAHELQRDLGIEHLVSQVATWRYVPRERTKKRRGAQVDLLFDRRDGVINLCEMKFSSEPFVVTKTYARELQNKLTLFEEHTRTKKRVILTLVSPRGVKSNVWSEDLVEKEITDDALFS